MPVPPRRLQDLIEGAVDHHASQACPAQQEVTITWQQVGERPTDPLTVVVAPFEQAGRTELTVPVDGREIAISSQARAGRHRVEVEGHHGEVLLDAPPGVELRR